MKGIATFVVLLLVGLGVVGYVVTRPVDRDLDAAERAWVRDFSVWRDTTARRVDAAVVGLGFESETRNARLLAPLRGCSESLARLGPAPSLLDSTLETVAEACGRAEHAASLDARYGVDSLASTKLHLSEAGDRLALALRDLRTKLGDDGPP